MSSIEISVTESLLISENVTPSTDKKSNALNSPRDKGSEETSEGTVWLKLNSHLILHTNLL